MSDYVCNPVPWEGNVTLHCFPILHAKPENICLQTVRIWLCAFQEFIYGLGDTLALRHLTTLLTNRVFPHVLQTLAQSGALPQRQHHDQYTYVTWKFSYNPIVWLVLLHLHCRVFWVRVLPWRFKNSTDRSTLRREGTLQPALYRSDTRAMNLPSHLVILNNLVK